MADVGTIGNTTVLGAASVTVPNYWSTTLGSHTEGYLSLSNGIEIDIGNLLPIYGYTTDLGTKAYVAGTAQIPAGITRQLGTHAITAVNFFTGEAVEKTTDLATKAISVIDFTFSTKTTAVGTKAFVPGVNAKQYGIVFPSASPGAKVPNYWTGQSQGRQALTTEIGFNPTDPLGFIGTEALTTQFGYFVPLPQRVYGVEALYVGIGTNPPDPLGFFGTEALTTQFGYFVPSPQRVYGFTTPLGEKAATLVPSVISLFLRGINTNYYGVHAELNTEYTTLQITSAGLPLSAKVEIEPLAGEHTLRASIDNRTIYISVDNVVRYAYIDERSAGPTVPDAPGKVGMQLQNMCIDTYYGVIDIPAPNYTVLNFDGLNDFEYVLEYYNGGTGNMGSSGPNYGISFETGTAVEKSMAGGGFVSMVKVPSRWNVIGFRSATNSGIMNLHNGVTGGISFRYSASFPYSDVIIKSGIDGTGSTIATIPVPVNDNGSVSTWSSAGISFAGTARSVIFNSGMSSGDALLIDNITLGSNIPAAEESTDPLRLPPPVVVVP